MTTAKVWMGGMVVLAMLGLMLAGAMQRYGDLPMTLHAQQAHEGQKWTAEKIVDYFDKGGCIPEVFGCPEEDLELAHCEVEEGKSILLVIGATIRQVVTGFMTRSGYLDAWERRCK
jgi:hypothetical protein